ncbi:spliceosome-associated protein CWC15 homolog [Cyclospora cayetanensis]|uniref:Spliceosome-associated protein CWC15 homolog n=1 Tax=Cyclospora cayetanensis TaxID=88456 RepID=A0A6P6RZQ9_9EIME|nr:spliceosome-associated protein CWC15 homolog [Cyclospora cayetanensis]
MTTAHRPTWHTALGGENQGGNRLATATTKRSAKDQPGELRLKARSADQLPATRDRKILAEELSRKEGIYQNQKKNALLTLTALPGMLAACAALLVLIENPFPEDADDVDAPAATHNDSDGGSDSSESSDDEEGELLRELEKIKKERAEKEAAAMKALVFEAMCGVCHPRRPLLLRQGSRNGKWEGERSDAQQQRRRFVRVWVAKN